jgi:arginine/lysine/ornithine decarboxylase
MPCYDPPMTQAEITAMEQERVRKQLEKFSHNSPVADMLCYVLRKLEEAEEPVKIQHLPENIHEWWEEHKERDRKKARAEKRKFDEAAERERALLKLTPTEKKLLGIK